MWKNHLDPLSSQQGSRMRAKQHSEPWLSALMPATASKHDLIQASRSPRRGGNITPIFQRRKQRLREVQALAQGQS